MIGVGYQGNLGFAVEDSAKKTIRRQMKKMGGGGLTPSETKH